LGSFVSSDDDSARTEEKETIIIFWRFFIHGTFLPFYRLKITTFFIKNVGKIAYTKQQIKMTFSFLRQQMNGRPIGMLI